MKKNGKYVKCFSCDKYIYIALNRLKRSKIICCSKECMGKARSTWSVGKSNPNYGKTHKFTIEQRKNMSIAHKGSKSSSWKGGLTLRDKCECGGEICDYRVKRCKKCDSIWRSKKYSGSGNPAWIDGSSFLPYPPTFNQQLKDRIRVRDNFICQKCGIPELELDKKLSIHHIDYDKNNCKEDNLISLCQYCNIRVNKNRKYYKVFFNKKVKV